MASDHSQYPPVSIAKAGFGACCPRCGQGKLYDGLLEPARQCNACGLDYSFIDSGDGPAAFVIMILGIIVLGLALIVDNAFHPPIWVHIVLWLPLIGGLGIYAMRVIKAMLIAQQYANNASQGQLDE